MKKHLFLMSIFLLVLCSSLIAQSSQNKKNGFSPKDTLVVIWTSGDREVAENVCLMYTHAAAKHDWFKKVILIVWGPSANLLANDDSLQSKIKSMISDKIHVQACIVCANSYGVSDKLRDIGIEVIGMGRPLTGYLKKGYSVLSF